MRETCARVLAAALMTGAIATVVAMSALSGAAGEAGRPISAPPSSLKRSVPVVAQAAAQRSRSVRLPRPRSSRPRPAVVIRSQIVVRHWRPRRNLAAAGPKTKPKPAPTPAPEPTPPTVEAAQIVEPPQPVAPADTQGQEQGPPAAAQGDHGNGRGHAYGHDKHDG